MTLEARLFDKYTHTQAGAKWAIDFFGTIHDVEQKQIKLHGRFIQEEQWKKKFRESFKPALDNSYPPVSADSVDLDLLYTMFREWYKNIGESSDNTTSAQFSSSADVELSNTENPFHEKKTEYKDDDWQKSYEKGLQLAKKYHPSVNRVIQLYSDILPKEFVSSHGETEYSQFNPRLTGLNNKRIYTWVLFTDEPTSDYPSLLEVELSCSIYQTYYLLIRMWTMEKKVMAKSMNVDVSDEEFEHDLVQAIKSIHRILFE